MEEYSRETPLFDRRFHVLVQYPDRDEKLQQLTIRLLTGARQNNDKNQRERVIRVEITDDDGIDPFFLYLWSVSEEEFHELKAQQRLLVDFATFPANLIELLQCCVKDTTKIVRKLDDTETDKHDLFEDKGAVCVNRGSVDAQHSRSAGPVPLSYLAVLNTSDGKGMSLFSIVETNPFKQLTHLSLKFFPGDDTAIKSYLAARLAQVGASRRSLASALKQTSEELQTLQSREKKLQQQLSTLSHDAESTLVAEKRKFVDEFDAQRRVATTALKERESELNAKMEMLVERYEKELQTLKVAAETSDSHVQDLNKLKYQHEMQIDHLQVQSQDLCHGKSVLLKEVEELRLQNKELDQKAFQQEKQVNTLQMRVDALQQQLADKEDVLIKTTDLLQSAKHHNDEIDDALKKYRDNHARLQQKLELSISEINKGNEIIERMQNENRGLKSKMRMKAKILKQQEQFIEEKQLQREEAVLELKSTKEDLRKRDEHILLLKGAIKELSQKLEDSNKLLASNQQGIVQLLTIAFYSILNDRVITWLNKEINEAQLGHQRRSTAHPSVVTFHPSDKVPP
ncbi:hypothetical protein CCR75_006471 [Bremia lactucae]|uniref:Spindle assembly abnormal protein 6 N-terminal domain-containing protein n=1 Tax=Bremia lactucae TaxID=4779 RepID=A0A976FSJ3_BRELC|nr:hypothetical protein CCR75_006471 [Bremia lactucae]